MVGMSVEQLAALYVVDSIKGFGPQKFKQLHAEGIRTTDVALDPRLIDLKGKRGDWFRSQLRTMPAKTRDECRTRATRQIYAAYQARGMILSYDSPHYPKSLYMSNNPSAILYVRGSPAVLDDQRAVACVGSRGVRPPYDALHAEFARAACGAGFAVVSGFALGADTLGHRAARAVAGRTICCMPGGLDRPFPPENKPLWEDLLQYDGAVFVSEYPFGTGASALTLRKRNKLIVAFARGVVISQSSESGGAMNAYRFAREQHKPVATFAADATDATSGNQLIEADRESRDAVFSASAPTDQDYLRWLELLSSST